MIEFGRILLIIGLAIGAWWAGLFCSPAAFSPGWAVCPGDFYFESHNLKFYVPLVTMLLVSILGTVLLNIFLYIFRR
jgi:hypothetical protein